MMTYAFVTTNEKKFRVYSEVLKPYGIELEQVALETPEVQDISVSKVAEFSAVWATRKLKKEVLVNDFGYYISALNGFPGPFSKYVISWFSLEDWLRLMEGIEDRRVEVRWAYAVASPDKKVRSIEFQHTGTILKKPGREGWNDLHRLYAPDGFNNAFSELSEEKRFEYWKGSIDHERLAKFIYGDAYSHPHDKLG